MFTNGTLLVSHGVIFVSWLFLHKGFVNERVVAINICGQLWFEVGIGYIVDIGRYKLGFSGLNE